MDSTPAIESVVVLSTPEAVEIYLDPSLENEKINSDLSLTELENEKEDTNPIVEIENPSLFTPIFQFPISEEANRSIEPSYRFGSTLFGERMPHDGIEILNSLGTPVLAAADGTVFFSGDDRTKKWGRYTNLYGNFIIIEHKFGDFTYPIYTMYAHLSELIVTEGESVTENQVIGAVGATGKAFTNHLHFEVRVGDVLLQNARNPELYLPLIPQNGEEVGIIIGSLLTKNGDFISGGSVVLQRMIDGEPQPGSSIYLETYAKGIIGDDHWQENFVVSNVQVGEYRISAFSNQYFIEKFISVNEDDFTTIKLQPEE
ncbi:MAG TPA: M23 family metallopeptidase [Anaerolineaceae bacterium]|nr:M23 family metallopeptidase [Anaerolineaceae bacterium]